MKTIVNNSKDCKYWLVWFKDNNMCIGTGSWMPIDGRLSATTIKANIKKMGAYKYRPKDANNYRLWRGSISNGNFITQQIYI